MMQVPENWTNTGKTIRRQFNFPDFITALAFVNQVGTLAEAAQHHPDIELGWGKVVITLSTHDAEAVTDKDISLAGQIDHLMPAA